MTELGVDVHHGATYHPQSQGAGERAVGRVKELLVRNGMTGAHQLADVVHVLNFNSSTTAGSGSPAMRMFGRPARSYMASADNTLTEEQKRLLQERLAKARAKAVKSRRQRSRQLEFMPGDKVLAWDHRRKSYSVPATVTSNMQGDDGYARSFEILTDTGVLRHYYSSWLVPQVDQVEQEEVAEQ